MYAIYVHKKKNTDYIFYVGQAKTKYRPYSTYFRNKHWHHIVNKYGFDVEIWCSNLDKQTADSVERFLINAIGRNDLGNGQLVNMTDGGEGNTGLTFTPEHKEKLSNAHKGLNTWSKNKLLGKHHSDATKNKMSKSHIGLTPWNKGKSLSIETRRKISESKQKQFKIQQILQYDLSGNFIAEWQSNELTINHVIACCKGQRKTAGGFIWKYKDDI